MLTPSIAVAGREYPTKHVAVGGACKTRGTRADLAPPCSTGVVLSGGFPSTRGRYSTSWLLRSNMRLSIISRRIMSVKVPAGNTLNRNKPGARHGHGQDLTDPSLPRLRIARATHRSTVRVQAGDGAERTECTRGTSLGCLANRGSSRHQPRDDRIALRPRRRDAEILSGAIVDHALSPSSWACSLGDSGGGFSDAAQPGMTSSK